MSTTTTTTTPMPPAGPPAPADGGSVGPRRPLVVLAVVVAAAVVAAALPLLVVQAPVLTVGALIAAAAALALATSPRRALLALVVLSPFEAFLATSASPLIVKAVGGVVVVAYVLQVLTRAGPPVPPSRVRGLLPLAVLVLLLLSSTAVHAHAEGAVSTAVRYLGFASAAVVAVAVLQVDGALRQVLSVLVLACTGAAAAGLWSFLSGATPRVDGPLDDPNDLAFFCAVAVPAALALARHARAGTRALWVTCALLLVLGAAGTLSRGAALALVAALGWAVLRGLVRLRTVVVAGVVVASLVGTLAALLPQVFDPALEQKTAVAGRNVDTRTLRWAAAIEMAVDAPLLGVGPGGFRLEYAGYEDPGRPDDETDVVAHQMYLETAAELGLPALAALLALMATAWAAASRAATAAVDVERDLALAVQAGLLITAVAALFLTEQYYLPLWLLVAAALALDVRRKAAL